MPSLVQRNMDISWYSPALVQNSDLTFDAYIEEDGASVMLGLRMQGTDNSQGLLFAIDTTGAWGLYSSVSDVGGPNSMAKGTVLPGTIAPGQWQNYHANVNQSILSVWIDGNAVVLKANVTFFVLPQNALGSSETLSKNVKNTSRAQIRLESWQ